MKDMLSVITSIIGQASPEDLALSAESPEAPESLEVRRERMRAQIIQIYGQHSSAAQRGLQLLKAEASLPPEMQEKLFGEDGVLTAMPERPEPELDEGLKKELHDAIVNLMDAKLADQDGPQLKDIASFCNLVFPRMIEGYLCYFLGLEITDGKEETCRQYEAVLQLIPDSRIYYYAGDCEIRNNNPQKASHYLEQAAQLLAQDDSESAQNLLEQVRALQTRVKTQCP